MRADRRFWEEHHARRRLVYPNEEVIRFLAYAFPHRSEREGRRALDLGAGSGRHTVLLARWDFLPVAVDLAVEGGRNAREYLSNEGLPGYALCARAQQLPFRDGTFALVLPWECIFYGDEEEVATTVREIRRVLTPGGWCFTNLRSPADSHVAEAEPVGQRVYRHRGEWEGQVFTVFEESDARGLFHEGFEVAWFDPYVISRRNGASREAGWTVLVQKK